MTLLADCSPDCILTVTDDKGNRERLRASPFWVNANTPLPMSIRLFFIAESSEQLADLICGPFQNVEQVESLVLQSASAWCHQNGTSMCVERSEHCTFTSIYRCVPQPQSIENNGCGANTHGDGRDLR